MFGFNPIIQHIEYNGLNIDVLRLDLIHPVVSGNKWFKLKYNIQEARRLKKTTLLTFGGAFSNHIAATAYAASRENLKSTGFIRGEAISKDNSTLRFSAEQGMELYFIDRETYRRKTDDDFLKTLSEEFPEAYIIPEGGSNELGIKGCEEILGEHSKNYDSIFCAVGTGATFSGMERSLLPHQHLIGIPVLKGFPEYHTSNSEYNNHYHFGGYAKHTDQLLEFKKDFELKTGVLLDYVYTAKSFFAAFDLLSKNKMNKDANTLIIHCGGLQGNTGYEKRHGL